MTDQRSPIAHKHHVVHVIGELCMGGTEKALINYVTNADRNEFRHTVLCFGRLGELAPTVEASGIPVRLVRIRHRHIFWSLPRMALWMRRNQVDVVHTHMYWAALWGRLAARMAGIPVVVNTFHGPETWKKRWHVIVERALDRWTSRHIAVAKDGLEIRLVRERVRPDHIVLIPNGVAIPERPRDPDASLSARAQLGVAPGTPLIGSVGRLVVEKGYVHMLEALRLARLEVPELRWLSIGDGPLKHELEARADELGLTDAIIWAGQRNDVTDLLPAMDLWVMSSIQEGLPVALLEAMAAGCPIVSTDIGGVPDALTAGLEARLVPAADPCALAAAIVEMLRDSHKAHGMGDAARARAISQYSIKSVARRIEEIYRVELAKH